MLSNQMFAKVTKALIKLNSHYDPSYAHGIICAVICCGKKANGKSWFESLVGAVSTNTKQITNAKKIILNLYETTFSTLQNDDFSFQLLLPDETTELEDRAEALSSWCAGFMSGLILVGVNWELEYPDDLKDTLLHFQEISSLDYEAIEVGDTDEQAFTDVYEYVRMAILYIFNELFVSSRVSFSGTVTSTTFH